MGFHLISNKILLKQAINMLKLKEKNSLIELINLQCKQCF